MANTSSTSTWVIVFSLAAIAAFFVAKMLFPQIIEQIAAGIVACCAFIISLIFRRNKKQT